MGERYSEAEIAGLFCEVLGLEHVSARDNFFDLGGQSLLATKLVSRVRDALDLEVGIGAIFEAPTASKLAELLSDTAASRPSLRSGSRSARLPLSFAQQRLWFISRLEGPSPTYNNGFLVKLTGDLNVSSLRSALADVIARHESLRTIFLEDDGEPWQEILPPAAVEFQLDFADVSESMMKDAVELASDHCFDIASEIPIRGSLFRITDRRHVLLLLVHHIASDGWSIEPLVRDLGDAYAARCDGRPYGWSPLPVQYADYTLWQRELMGEEGETDGRLTQQLDYWRRTLHALPEEIELPVDRPRPLAASSRGGRVEFTIDETLHQRLLKLAQGGQATLFMVLQVGLSSLLTRLGSGNDIVLGSPIAGRTDVSMDALIGFFVNTLALRIDTSGYPTTQELLARVRRVDLAAYAHQDLPFERLVEVLNPARSSGRHPVFQVMLALQNFSVTSIESHGLVMEPELAAARSAKFDLTFTFNEKRHPNRSAAGIVGSIGYASDLFDQATVQSFAERLLRLFEGMVDAPDQPIGQINLLDDLERLQLKSWNEGHGGLLAASLGDLPAKAPDANQDTLYPTDRPLRLSPDGHLDVAAQRAAIRNDAPLACIAQGTPACPVVGYTLPLVLECQAKSSPNAIAVLFGEDTLTYFELHTSANRLAHLLIAQGVGPEDIVAVAVSRSAKMIVVLLAILKSGAAFLQFNLAHPLDRLRFMLEDAKPRILITDQAIAEGLHGDIPHLDLNNPVTVQSLSQSPGTNPTDGHRQRSLKPLNPAYIIYTSGSTGSPKGVAITHESICRKISGNRKVLGLDSNTCYVALAPIGFDPLVTQLISPLAAGGRTMIISDADSLDPATIWRQATREARTILGVTPTRLGQLIEHFVADECPAPLYALTVGGESLSAQLATAVMRSGIASRIINFYGPTETCIDATAWQIAERVEDSSEITPIGTPLENYKLYVLDDFLMPVPAKVKGEVYIAGPGLARGYIGRPGLTAERFVADPFGEPGSRMYRTGDLAHWRPDGALVFLGRCDQQVKVRGFRVEPGEIEAVLTAHPTIKQAVIVTNKSGLNRQDLVGYVVARPGKEVDTVGLRTYLAERLPNYMVPAFIVSLDVLPVTPNGKIDHKSLPDPPLAPGGDRPPRTQLEVDLCRIFADVLQVDHISIDDSFFELGGHSLLATRVVSRVRSTLRKEISIRALFEAPTVVGLAERLKSAGTARSVLRPRRPARYGGA